MRFWEIFEVEGIFYNERAATDWSVNAIFIFAYEAVSARAEGTNGGMQTAQEVPLPPVIFDDPIIDSIIRPMIKVAPEEVPPEAAGKPTPPGWSPDWKWRAPEGTGKAGPRWFDPQGGEWRFHPADKWHDESHWDYNPHEEWNSPWQNVPMRSVAPAAPSMPTNCYDARMCT